MTESLFTRADRALLRVAERLFGERESWAWWQDARRGHPETVTGKTVLRTVAVVQILATIVLSPAAALWYGLHEMPGWFRESLRVALKTLIHGRTGPYKGIVW